VQTGTIFYAISSLMGYFGHGSSPILRFSRMNSILILLFTLALGEIFMGFGSGMLLVSLFTTLYLSSNYTSGAETEQTIMSRFV